VITFLRDQYNAPRFDSDERLSALGSLLTSDVQNGKDWNLDLLAWIDDVRTGRLPEQTWNGNSWMVHILPDSFELDDIYSDDWRGKYTLDEAQRVLLDYLRFLAPSAVDRAQAVADWEEENGREHPLRAQV
jgi:hypothetical protein